MYTHNYCDYLLDLCLQARRCDGIHDCHSGEDEHFCPPPGDIEGNCPSGQFRCNKGSCIPAEFVCDGQTDCLQVSCYQDRCGRTQQVVNIPDAAMQISMGYAWGEITVH